MYNRQLILQDGSVYKGYSFGDNTDSIGELVFNTAMTGYQETISDPSYNGQIITFTYPLIGNYGINKDDFESITPAIKGVVVKEFCQTPSNFRAEFTLEQLLNKHQIPGICGVDTRSLTKKIRKLGVCKAAICSIDADIEQIVTQLQQTQLPNDQISQMSGRVASNSEHLKGYGRKVVVIDLGLKTGIIDQLEARGCVVATVPFDASASQIFALKPDGVMLTNGPGDPEDATITIQTIKQLLGKVPIFGICMGHQLLSLACGAKTYKLKFGHRGCNQPVKNLLTGRVDITSQNHGYAVNINSLKGTDLELTHIAVNDKSCEGVKHKIYSAFSVQYHPEANPGPHDSRYLFDQFIEEIENFALKSSKR